MMHEGRSVRLNGGRWKFYSAVTAILLVAGCTTVLLAVVAERIHERFDVSEERGRKSAPQTGAAGLGLTEQGTGAALGEPQQLAAALASDMLKPEWESTMHAFELRVADEYTSIERLALRLEHIDPGSGRFAVAIRAGELSVAESDWRLDVPIVVKTAWADQPYLVVLTDLQADRGSGYVRAPAAGTGR